MGKARRRGRSARARAVFARADAALGEPLSTLCFEGPIEDAHAHREHAARARRRRAARSSRRSASAGRISPRRRSPPGTRSASTARSSPPERSRSRTRCASCRLRGAAMQDAVPPGAGRDGGDHGPRCRRRRRALRRGRRRARSCSPANFNAPGQIVIAGHARRGRARAASSPSSRGGKAIPLKVSAPFHCALMRPAADAPRRRARATSRRAARLSRSSPTSTREPNTEPARVPELLVRQVDGPVRVGRSDRAHARARASRTRSRSGRARCSPASSSASRRRSRCSASATSRPSRSVARDVPRRRLETLETRRNDRCSI